MDISGKLIEALGATPNLGTPVRTPGFAFATMQVFDPANGGVGVIFDGESGDSGQRYYMLGAQVPAGGDRVVMLKAGDTYLCLGAFDRYGYQQCVTMGADQATTASFVTLANINTGNLIAGNRYVVDWWLYFSAAAVGNNGFVAQVNFPTSYVEATIMVDGYDSAGAVLRQMYNSTDVGGANPKLIGRDIGPIGTASVANNDWVHIQVNCRLGVSNGGALSLDVKTVGTGATIYGQSNMRVVRSR